MNVFAQSQNVLADTLQGSNMSHLGKRNIIFKSAWGGDMAVPTRVLFENKGLRLHFVNYYSTTHLSRVGWQGLAICERCEGWNFWNHAVQIDWTTKNLFFFQHPAFTPTFLLPLQQVLAFFDVTPSFPFWSKATGTRSGKISSLFLMWWLIKSGKLGRKMMKHDLIFQAESTFTVISSDISSTNSEVISQLQGQDFSFSLNLGQGTGWS